MNAPRVQDALHHLDDALDALLLSSVDVMPDGSERPSPLLQATIGEDLDRVDRAIGGHGRSSFALLAEQIRRAVAEIELARQALGASPAEVTPP